jgi:hypothetical protein
MDQKRRDRVTWQYAVWESARRRARATGTEFTLTLADVEQLAADNAHCCALTGIPFDFAQLQRGTESRRPFFPSLDRITPKGPYSLANVRLVLVAMNIALSDWGEDVFRMLAQGYLERFDRTPWRWTRKRNGRCLRGVKRLRGADRSRPFEARVSVGRRSYHLGCFATEGEAHRAYTLAKARIAADLPVMEDISGKHHTESPGPV